MSYAGGVNNRMNPFNLSGSNFPPLGAKTFADVFGFDTLRLAAGLFIQYLLYLLITRHAEKRRAA